MPSLAAPSSLYGLPAPTPSGVTITRQYWVAPPSAGGSDTRNTGTTRYDPFATIAHAVSVVNALGSNAPGTWVHVASGSYTEPVLQPTVSGTAVAPIVFVSDTLWTAQVVGTDSGAVFYPFNNGLNSASGLGYIYIIGFDVSDASPHTTVCGIKPNSPNVYVWYNYIHDLGNSLANGTSGGAIDCSSYGDGLNPMGRQILGNVVMRCGPTAGGNQWQGIYATAYGDAVLNNLVGNIFGGYGIHCFHLYTNGTVCNNTVFNAVAGGILVGNDTNAATLTQVNNNICYACGGWGIRTFASGSGSIDNTTCANNLLFACASGTTLFAGAHDVATGTVLLNPAFVNYQPDGSGDYRLSSASPAIAAGTGYLSPTTDILGTSRVALSRYDIGAYAYVVTGVAAPRPHPTLAIYTYNLTTGVVTERSAVVDNLDITTGQPAGYLELSCDLRVPNARIVPSDLQLFANIAVMDGPFCVFSGRLDEPAIALTDQDADLYRIHAMGGADCLKDDPEDVAYSNQTPQAIFIDQISTFQSPGGAGNVARSVFLPLDQDTSAIFPDNPSAQYSPDPNSKCIEDVFNEVIPLVGDYAWCVWGHPTHRDACGFPTWQLAVHKRDVTTVAYTGFLSGEGGGGSDAYSIRPAVEYSYNVVRVKYRDASTDLPSSVAVRDGRLNTNNTQGSAPFPYRKLDKDFSSIHMTGTEALAVANAVLANYQNGGWKNEVVLSRVYDANGNEIPLWQVRADANIFLPELSPIGQQLPTTIVPSQGASSTTSPNLYYITQTHYSEASGQVPTLTLTLDSFFDSASFQVARLEYIHNLKSRNDKVKHTVREAGNPETGAANMSWPSQNTAGGTVWSCTINFKTSLTSNPPSVALSAGSTSNLSGKAASAITNVGFELDATAAAAGGGYYRGTYTAT